VSCAGLVLLVALAAEAPPRLDLDLAFAYGNGSRSAFGGLAGATAGWQVWETPGTTGTVDVGLLAGYQNEPYSQTAALLAPMVVTGSNHRSELFVVAGPSVRLLPSRRLLLGLQAFAGVTLLSMRGSLTDSGRGVSGSYRADAAEVTLGAIGVVGIALTERLSIVGRFLLPVPYAGVAVSSYFMATLGVSLRL